MNKDEKILRDYIRKVLQEQVNNFLDKEEETDTKELDVASNKENLLIGDPLDVELNQLADNLGSDGKIAPALTVKAGSEKGRSDYNAGQKQAVFNGKISI